ncbi:MAG: hypothetical protein ABI388_03475 [Bacteroidia bacterium]
MAKKAAKKTTKKPAKKRASKYDGKLAIIGTLDEVLKVSIPKK